MVTALLFFPAFLTLVTAQYYGQPEQVHLSHGGDTSKMYVTWTTFNSTAKSQVNWGENGRLQRITDGTSTKFVDGGVLQRVLYIHRVLLTGLKPGQGYLYQVGSPEAGWSVVYFFKALKEPHDGYTYVVYGDLGNINGRSIPRLQQGVQKGEFDMVLHVGDLAYNMATNDGRFGDQFMRQIEPIAAYVPYMVVAGNHEYAYNFSNYRNRFTMPGGDSNIFYSFDLGPAHFIGFSTEVYFFAEQYGFHQAAVQYEWLQEDLKKASANRHNVPWIITMGHRPMYCTNLDTDDCTKFESVTRLGFPVIHAYGLEDLFYKYGVDLEIWAHEHSYERMYPVYNRTVYNGTADPYFNPPAPVHIVTGSAGCQENTDPFQPNPPPWSAFRSSDYGYSIMKVHNKTHIEFMQKSDNQGGKVIDHIWVRKQFHGPYEDFAHLNQDPGTYVAP